MTGTLTRSFHVEPIVVEQPHARCRAPVLTAAPPPTGLPHEVSSFVGRETIIETIVSQMSHARLITLTGVGGVGKTRLALQVARRLAATYDSCSFVSLSGITDAAEIARSVADSRMCATTRRPMAALRTILSAIDEQRTLLVLDNCEHLISDCAAAVMQLLQGCGGLRVLATSREPLGVPGEVVLTVPPLSLPDLDGRPEGQFDSEAVQLFVERARARQPYVQFTAETILKAARLCLALGGLPLAIELAAALTTSMSVGEIYDRLDDLLTAAEGSRGLPSRQQSLRASVEWSYVLLGDREQRVLRRLSVLEDGFTLADAAAACAGDDLPPQHLVPAIDRLVGQSVLRCAESNSVTHFSLYAHVRQYARELLEEPGELARARPRAESARIKVQVGVKAEPAQASLSAPVRNASERYAETLSQREREVVRLIADGRSNRDIAEELVITKKTAEAHVSHILTKLGLCSRVQVATWSLQHDVTTGVG